ncbi:MAG: carboxypeptidase regulatory-like domain-containing protein, partial [Myxococcales bacterium]|nr:carboxypeptidase regulatory-like domain-containing protein [Myxococcales bacterium]
MWAVGALLAAAVLAPGSASAAPPALPSEDRSGAVEVDEAPAEEAADAEDGEAPAAEAEVSGEASVELGDVGGDADGSGSVDPFADLGGSAGGGDEAEDGGSASVKDDDPAMLHGRREPAVNTVRGGLGLFGTTLADTGGRHTVRFGLHTDLFRRSGFIYDSSQYGQDTNSRFRGTVNIGYSPLPWGEIFLSISSQANRNEREQPGRQDDVANFALGDIDLGIKGAHRFFRGGAIGLGGQMALGLLSGTTRLASERVNFGFDVLFTLDARYLTKKAFPFRFTTNIGWILDNSLKVLDFSQISDTTSREVTRFALGVNHSRVRMRYGVDFPLRVGKDRQIGLDPIAELAWDVSTFADEDLFGQPGADPVSLPRTSLWSTLGLRANVISGLHLDAALDIGMVSPAFEYGPPVPPWQLLFGFGWAFDPKPVIKEVAAPDPAASMPPPVTDGRIVGEVVDESGTPIGGAVITFPGLTTTAILADDRGSFTSFRFPAGEVTVVVTLPSGATQEASAMVEADSDTPLTITFGGDAAAAPSGILDGSFV